MNNKSALTISSTFLLISILGCSFYNPLESSTNSSSGDNRTLTDKAIESTVGVEKIGIPECDEIIDFFADQSKNPDDDLVRKAAREYALGKVREAFKQSVEENKGNKTKMAKDCRAFKIQMDKFKTEENGKKSEK